MMKLPLTVDQFYMELKQKVCSWIYDILAQEEVYNSRMWCDGTVNAVNADDKHADVYINAASAVTSNVPIANGLTVAVNDQVVILNRAKMRDLVILYKKVM